MRRFVRRTVLLAVTPLVAGLTLVGHAGSRTYEVAPFDAAHETMTKLAEACAAAMEFRTSGSGQERCSTAGLDYAGAGSMIWRRVTFRRRFTDSQNASRWPDFPTQSGGIGLPRFLFDIRGGCEERLAAVRDDRQLSATLGLVCHSHFGELQFLHAMASERSERAAEDTRAKMLAWARLTYRVATNRIGPSEGYCDTIRQSRANGLAPIADDLLGVIRDGWCDERQVKGETYPPWRAYTLFSLKCRNLFSWEKCSEVPGGRGIDMARRNARGALLHMIQDSYSTSHTVREGQAGHEYTPRAICGIVTAYFDYNDEANQERHADADSIPTFACGPDDAIHDPITASAHVIRLLEAPGDQEEALITYIEAHVLGPAPEAGDPA